MGDQGTKLLAARTCFVTMVLIPRVASVYMPSYASLAIEDDSALVETEKGSLPVISLYPPLAEI